MIKEHLEAFPHNKLYLERYCKLMEYCRQQNFDIDSSIYTEKHHILPKSMFPEYKSLFKHKWNCIVLTPRQHYLAHWMLAKCFSGGMWLAFKRMLDTGHKDYVNARIYESVRSKAIQTHKGRVLSEETKEKIRLARQKQIMPPCPESKKEAIRQKNKGTKPAPHTMKALMEYIENRPIEQHPRARIILIYDDNNKLRYKCHGNMRQVCNDADIPFNAFRESLKSGLPVPPPKKKNGEAAEKRRSVMGWYAVYGDTPSQSVNA